MNDDLKEYYKNLLILQYQDKPKATETVKMLIGSIMIYDLINSVRNGYKLETASGIQLDILGKYIGINRVLTGFSFERLFFGFQEYDTVTPIFEPFIEYGGSSPAKFASYEDSQQSQYAMTDAEYRFMLRLKVLKNLGDVSTQNIDDIITDFFGVNATFTDNNDMTITYEFDTSLSFLINIAETLEVLPRPMGVEMIVSFV